MLNNVKVALKFIFPFNKIVQKLLALPDGEQPIIKRPNANASIFSGIKIQEDIV